MNTTPTRHPAPASRSRFDRGAALAALAVLTTIPIAAQPRLAFVTSATGSGDLSSWPGTDLSGLAAADEVCSALATDAGLPDPSSFVAWISDGADDAYCRVHGRTGRIDDAMPCGQATLPDSAGPWVRTDGSLLAHSASRVVAPHHELLRPLWLDENGTAVGEHVVFTGTDWDGGLDSSGTCNGWQEDTGSGEAGTTDAGAWTWASHGALGCGADARIYCLQIGAGDPVSERPSPGRRAFVTSASGSGDLASWTAADPGELGLSAGDSICRHLASAAGVPLAETFRAWLSDSATDAASVLAAVGSDGPWVRLDGVRIADSDAELVSGILQAPIDLTETGHRAGNRGVWTGTVPAGVADADHCGDWRSTSGDGLRGNAARASDRWTENGPSDCSFTSGALYCLGAADLSFADGFESGDTSAWGG